MDLVTAERLEHWVARIAVSLGYRVADAAYLAGSLVDANLRGVDSHGVIRLPIYAERIQRGLVDPKATPEIDTNAGIVRVTARRAPGQLAARAACEALVTAARAQGVATAVVRGSAHFGAAGFYARTLASAGFVALVMSNSEPAVVPYGGREALLGTNPIAFAAPTCGEPFNLDMATSATAMGKVVVAGSMGESIPPDWGVDAAGQPTTDPHAVSALLPLGGAKGFALALMVEVLGGVLSGAAFGQDLGNQYLDLDRPQNIGHWMLAIDVAAVMPPNQFKDRMRALSDMASAITPAEPTKPVLLPGEPEQRVMAHRRRHGIPLADGTVNELAQLGARYGIPWEEGEPA